MRLQLFELFPASFRGIPFLMSVSSSQGGRKTATHEFVNSDKRFTEDLGLKNRTFTLTAVVSGEFYVVKRNALIEALNTPEIGILVHPFEGVIEVTPTTFTLDESTKDLGTATFSMTFEKSQPNESPFPSLSSLSQLFSEAENTIQSINADMSDDYSVPGNSSTNFSDSSSKIDTAASLFTINTQRFASDQNFTDTFQGALSNYKDDSIALVSNPTKLADDTSNLFKTANDLAPDSTTGLALMQTFYDYGDDDDPINAITLQREERQRNRGLMNSLMQATALVISYTNASAISYTTTTDIQTVSTILENQYEKVIQNEFLSDTSLNNLNTLRAQMAEFFRNAEVTAFRIGEVKTNVMPMSILAYQYYEDLDDVETLVDLNDIQDVSFVEGTINVLTQ